MPIIIITGVDARTIATMIVTTIAAPAKVYAQKRNHAKLHQKPRRIVHRLRLPPQQQQQPQVPLLQPQTPLQLWTMAVAMNQQHIFAIHIPRYQSATKESAPKRKAFSAAAVETLENH